MRAMPLEFPDDALASARDEQYMFGPSLLAAPVVAPGGTTRVCLPRGGWFDLSEEPLGGTPPPKSGSTAARRIEGGGVIEQTIPLDRIPLYGREGAIVRLGPVVQHTGELPHRTPVSDVLVFGVPRPELALPGLDVQVEAADGRSRVSPIPTDARLRVWGEMIVERRGAVAKFRPARVTR